ncbi:MAG: lipid II:glycine glycyltransferase FemX [Ktedonobacteraceae bacterium]
MKTYQSKTSQESATPLRVVELSSTLDKRWEAFMRATPHSLIYHHPVWVEVLEEAFGYKPINLGCEDAHGELQGVLPLLHTRGLLSGRRLSSLPRTPVAGPLSSNAQAMAMLVDSAVKHVREMESSGLQFKMLTNELDGLVDEVVGSPWRATYVLELPEQPETLRFGNSRNHAQIKRAVNKASKLGVQVYPAESERELRTWYDLYLDTMRWVVVPPRPYHFFEVAWRRLHPLGMMKLLLATHHESGRSRIIGGLLLLMFGQTVFYAFSGWRREDQALRPNNALHWHAIHDACSDGFRFYDFGEVPNNNPGLSEFKSKWGAERKWMYRYYYPAPRELEISMLDSNSRVHQIAGEVWKRLPIKAVALLGGLAHRYF